MSTSDFTAHTVMSLLGLCEWQEFFITVDHSAKWRRHLVWAKQDGSELRTLVTQRFASSMVFMSLLLSAEVGLLFNSSKVTTDMRQSMMARQYGDIEFWIGLLLLIGSFLTLFTLISTFTVWGMVSVVSDSNSHCILRSSIGQYVTEFPSRLLVLSLYSFLLSVSLWAVVLLPGMFSIGLVFIMGLLFFHMVALYSAFGRLIMLSGAMGAERVFEENFEQALLPSGLHTSLLIKAKERQKKRMTVTVQYRDSAKKSNSRKKMTSSAKTQKNSALERMPGEARRHERGGGVNSDRKPTASNKTHHRMASADSILSEESFILRMNAQALSGGAPSSIPLQPNPLANAGKGRPVTPLSIDAPHKSSHCRTPSVESSEFSLDLAQIEHLPPSELNKPDRSHESMARFVDNVLDGKAATIGGAGRTESDGARVDQKVSGGGIRFVDNVLEGKATTIGAGPTKSDGVCADQKVSGGGIGKIATPLPKNRGGLRRSAPSRFAGLQRTLSAFGGLQLDASAVRSEWEDEADARNMYHHPPAANPEASSEEEDEDGDDVGPTADQGFAFPRPSLLNSSSHSRRSILRLTGEDSGGTHEPEKKLWPKLSFLGGRINPATAKRVIEASGSMREGEDESTGSSGSFSKDIDETYHLERGEVHETASDATSDSDSIVLTSLEEGGEHAGLLGGHSGQHPKYCSNEESDMTAGKDLTTRGPCKQALDSQTQIGLLYSLSTIVSVGENGEISSSGNLCDSWAESPSSGAKSKLHTVE